MNGTQIADDGSSSGRPARFVAEGLLGTRVEVTVRNASAPSEVAGDVFGEIERLQQVFDWFDPASELRRWSRGDQDPGTELAEVLDLADSWRRRSGGAFDAAAGHLVALWDEAARAGSPPSDERIEQALIEMADRRRRPHSLNAIAKGWIVDRAARTAWRRHRPGGLTVNGGGDLVHVGSDVIVVGIEDPLRPHDNVAPLMRIPVADAALATSGTRRRGWTIDGRWYGHVVDPRSGYPTGHVASASVLAPDLATADAAATVLTVVGIEDGLAFCDDLGLAAAIVGIDGSAYRTSRWADTEISPGSQPVPSSHPGALRTVLGSKRRETEGAR